MRVNINLSQVYSKTHPVGKPTAVIGLTELGEIGKPTNISSRDEFLTTFGYCPANVNTFTEGCLSILDAGGKLLVSRVGARTNPLDDTTQQGSYAVIDDRSATVVHNITNTVSNSNGLNGFYVDIPSGTLTSIHGVVLKGQKAVTFDITGNEYTYYTISKVSVYTTEMFVHVNESVPSAITGSGNQAMWLNAPLTNPAIKPCILLSKENGEIYQDFTITSEMTDKNIPPTPFFNGFQNITITFPSLLKSDGTPVSQILYNYPVDQFTAADVTRFNNECKYFKIDVSLVTSNAFFFNPLTKIVHEAAGTYLTLTNFTNGNSYSTNISSSDYIGNSTVGYGIHSFDNFDDFYRIAQLNYSEPIVDKYIENYCAGRKFCRAILPMPKVVGITATEYRLGNLKPNTAYFHVPCDTYFTSYIYGHYKVKGIYTSVVPLAIIARNIKDLKGLHYSPSDTNVVPAWNSLDIYSNIYGTTPAADSLMETVRLSGISPFVDIKNNQRFYGGKTNLLDINTPFSNESVVDCAMYLRNALAADLPNFLFNPQDVATWKRIVQSLKDILNEMSDSLISTKEGVGYIITGDQYAADITKAVYNTQADIALGLYKFKLQVKFKGTIEFITFDFVVNATNVSF